MTATESAHPVSPSRAALAAVGIALIVLPIVALGLKFIAPGWLLVMLMFASPVLLLGFALQVIIAISGFLIPRALFASATAARRATIAGWVTAWSSVLAVLFLVDGGDSGDWGSLVMYMFGAANNVAFSDVSTFIAFFFAAVLVAGWVWLTVEWIRALVQRRRAVSPAAPAADVPTA